MGSKKSYPNGYLTTFKDENGVWKRKCSRCGEVKLLNSANFSPKGTGKDAFGLVRRYNYCRDCQRIRNRESYAKRVADPERKKMLMERLVRNSRAWREANPEKYAVLAARAVARRAERYRNDQEFRERFLAIQREQVRARRLEAGLPVIERYPGVKNAVVPVGPFREWLRIVVDLEPESVPNGGWTLASDGKKALAARLGASERSLRRLLTVGDWVSVHLADRAIHGYDGVVEVRGRQIVTFDDLYGRKVPLETRPSDARAVFGDSFSGEVLPE